MNREQVELLRRLVVVESVSGQEDAAVAYLVEQMARRGLAARVDEVGNAVGVRVCPDAEGQVRREIMLLGHIDTVPGHIAVRVENGRLYGRGAVDAKGPLAAFVCAAAEAHLLPGTRVVVVGAVEEEAATSRGARHVARHYRPDWCIIGEPSGWDALTLGYKGRVLIDYELWRPMSHSAGPEVGVPEMAVEWYNVLAAYVDAYNQDRPRLFEQLLLSIREIATSSDGLNNHVYLKVGLRLPPDFDIEALAADARGWVEDGQLRVYGYEPAYQGDGRNELVAAFNRALRKAGVRPRHKLKTGTADMNVVGRVWDCPVVAYGPGDSSLDHTPEEHIVLEEYERAIEVLKGVLGCVG